VTSLGPQLILVPTDLERRLLAELGGWPDLPQPQVCGFGPVSAAARTAGLLALDRPRRVWLVGVAGALRDLEPGTARLFTRVRLDGIGAGQGDAFRAASELGFPPWEDEHGPVAESLALAGSAADPAELLTVCSASASPAEAAARRARYPAALAEDMEAFGAALACRMAGVELAVVRGISNRAGDREHARWRLRECLAAARALLLDRVHREVP
jgi:futalosine hydrolase